MITISPVYKLLDNKTIPCPHSQKLLSKNELKLAKQLKAWHILFDEEAEVVERKTFLNAFFYQLLQEAYEIHLFFVEVSPSTMSRSRSHKGLLYGHSKQLGIGVLQEYETVLAENKSILYSKVILTKENVDYVLKHLINSSFSFGLVQTKGETIEEDPLTSDLKRMLSASPSRLDSNQLLLGITHVQEHRLLFYLGNNGLDQEFVNVWYQQEAFMDKIRKNIFSKLEI